ncbi:3-phosphoserine/phosphohydroxythreonine transaminase [Ferruginibacter sp.]|uniref:3-phosphoserine/phosphohydroxythreonine transaminase n=1 Tax=Ferruginibacter sp. TaxID=1940288 RepID=UPI002658E3F1|nr:3-phosphoserine/phosphohydroxythreonine transaminase [Ferruginibacter sp.]
MVHNFNAGPSILPKEVFEQASEAVLNYQNSGLSILEIGHRTSTFQAVMDEAKALVKDLMQLDADREVLFLHGGASTQFMQVPMNLLDDKETAAYSDTGVWGIKAIKEAKLFGKIEVVCTGKESNYTIIPKDFAVPNDAKYFHITTNNTIYGSQWQKIPKTSIPLIGDMSSDIFSRVIDFNAFDLIYAGAQKNMGPAGVNLLVVNPAILGKVKRAIPSIMDYRNHIKAGSMFNTPPVFAVFVCMLTLRWLKALGGVPVIEKLNDAKATLLYHEIDNNPLFTGTVAKEDRSKMNACFVMNNPSLEEPFLNFTKQKNIVGIKGHRLVGGFRASLYNALPISSVEILVQAMKEFTLLHA